MRAHGGSRDGSPLYLRLRAGRAQRWAGRRLRALPRRRDLACGPRARARLRRGDIRAGLRRLPGAGEPSFLGAARLAWAAITVAAGGVTPETAEALRREDLALRRGQAAATTPAVELPPIARHQPKERAAAGLLAEAGREAARALLALTIPDHDAAPTMRRESASPAPGRAPATAAAETSS